MIKRSIGVMILFITALWTAGCSSAPSLSLDVDTSTVLVLKDGTVQSVSVEEFTEDYYSEDELGLYISETVQTYNSSVGEDVVSKDGLNIEDGKATLSMQYNSVDTFASFNRISASLVENKEEGNDKQMPDEFLQGKDQKKVKRKKVLEHTNAKVLYIADPGVHIQVQGTILYYANGSWMDEKTIEAGKEGTTIVVFE